MISVSTLFRRGIGLVPTRYVVDSGTGSARERCSSVNCFNSVMQPTLKETLHLTNLYVLLYFNFPAVILSNITAF